MGSMVETVCHSRPSPWVGVGIVVAFRMAARMIVAMIVACMAVPAMVLRYQDGGASTPCNKQTHN